jgi:hypothetical protein
MKSVEEICKAYKPFAEYFDMVKFVKTYKRLVIREINKKIKELRKSPRLYNLDEVEEILEEIKREV